MENICVDRVCEHCNQDYLVPLILTGDKTQAYATFHDCTECGKRNDVWIKIYKSEI